MGEAPSSIDAAATPAPAVDDATFQVDLSLPFKDARAVLSDQFEARYLDALLARVNGNISAAARLARMTRSHLSELLARRRR
jgi:DNA-binding NtrC family response regulator